MTTNPTREEVEKALAYFNCDGTGCVQEGCPEGIILSAAYRQAEACTVKMEQEREVIKRQLAELREILKKDHQECAERIRKTDPKRFATALLEFMNDPAMKVDLLEVMPCGHFLANMDDERDVCLFCEAVKTVQDRFTAETLARSHAEARAKRAEAMLAEVMDFARHTHCAKRIVSGPNTGALTDSCAVCGLDIRHEVHATAQAKAEGSGGEKGK